MAREPCNARANQRLDVTNLQIEGDVSGGILWGYVAKVSSVFMNCSCVTANRVADVRRETCRHVPLQKFGASTYDIFLMFFHITDRCIILKDIAICMGCGQTAGNSPTMVRVMMHLQIVGVAC